MRSFSNSIPTKNPLTGTPKRPRTASDDDQVFHTHIEELISSSIKTELSKIGDTLTASILETVQKSVKSTIEENLKSLRFDLDICKKQHGDIAEDIDKMQYCQRDITRRLSVLEKENSVLRSKLNQLETHSRKNNIKVLGLPNVVDEACSSTLLKVFKSVGVNIRDNDIVEAYRVYSSVQPRPVIVKLCNSKLKPLLFKHNKMLKSQHNISVQDDVPPQTYMQQRKLFYQSCMKLKKSPLLSRDITLKCGMIN